MQSVKKTKYYKDPKNSIKRRILYVITSPYRFFKALCFFIGLFVVILSTIITLFAVSFFNNLPDFEKLEFDQLKQIAQQRVESRLKEGARLKPWVPIDQMSRDYLFALVMSEDSSYFEHAGVDYDAMIDSMAANLKSGEIRRGGSTISQQVVKNMFLTSERSYLRKIKEVLITRRMESHLTKNQILELYFNLAEFGPNIFGVRSASRAFFNKTPKQINAAEGAFLALMLPSPRRYHYSIFQNENLTNSKKRKLRRILMDMVHNEFISYQQYKRYIKYDFFKNKRSVSSKR